MAASGLLERQKRTADLLVNVDFVSVNALLPFIAEESSTRIVSSSVIDYVSLGPLTDNDEMSPV